MKIYPVIIFLVESVYISESHCVQVTEADSMSQVTAKWSQVDWQISSSSAK